MPMPQYNGPTYGYNPYQTYLPQSPWQGPQPYTQPQTAQLPVQQVQTQANPPLVGHIVTARDITENQNTNYRQLHDELVAYRMEDKDNTIAELRSQVNALNLSASQSNQNAYLVAQLKTPAPVPAYTVPNPNGYYGCQQNCYQSCGC